MSKQGRALGTVAGLLGGLRPALLIAKGIVRRANAARDAGRYHVAAALYGEALLLAPGRVSLRIQCGHMLKEAGDFDGAEDQYLAAASQIPDDPDLALQLGHFYKIAGRPDESEAAYRRATMLRPGWAEAERELSGLRSFGDGALPEAAADGVDWLVPELLPAAPSAPGASGEQARDYAESIHIHRLGVTRERSRWGNLRVLRGIEAIRGYCIAAVPIVELIVLIGDQVIHRGAPESFALDGAKAGQRKYVFNLWLDFSAYPAGPHQIELRFVNARQRTRVQRRNVLIAAPLAETERPSSDTMVALIPGDPRPIDQQINARPSIVRPARRTLLPHPPRAILVQRVDQLGDMVCSVPAVRRLRALFPEAKMVGLLSRANAAFAQTLGLFDAMIVADFAEDAVERRRVMPLEKQEALRRELLPHRFDLAIDLSESAGSRPLLLLSGAPFLYGFKDRESPFLTAGLDVAAHDPANALEIASQSQKVLALVEGLAALLESPAQVVRRGDLDRARLASYGIGPDDRFAVLHTGARLAYSRWPHFETLAALLLERTDLKLLILFDDRDGDPGFAAPAGADDRLRLIRGQLPFDDFDAMLSFCAAFVGNDSGPKHLAALRGANVVSIHMARLNWNEWGQEISGSIVSRRVPCAGCAIAHEPEECGKDFACLRHIRPEEVLGAVLSLLERS